MALPRMLQNRWWMVAAAVVGLTVNAGVVSIFGFGVFLKPVTEGLGIGRGTLGAAQIVGSICSLVATPLFGRAIDRFGVRAVHLPMIVAFALSTAAMGLLQPSLAVIYLLYGLHALTGAGQSPVAYSKVIAGWFDKERGLALGIAIAGVGLGVVIIPQVASYLIRNFGWRTGYAGLGVAILVLAFVPVAVFMRDPPTARAGRDGDGAAPVAGASLGEAVLHSWRFWAMTVAFFFVVVAVNGTLGQIVALLTDRGLSLRMAIDALSAAGVTLTLGRILSGFLLDRFHGPYVASFFFVAAMAGIAVIASGAGGAAPLLGTLLCGLGIGAEVDLMAFFVSRYFGLRAFGAIYGAMFAMFSLGNGVGPYLMGRTFDRVHSYVPMLVVFEVLLALASLLLLALGPYRFAAHAARRKAAA